MAALRDGPLNRPRGGSVRWQGSEAGAELLRGEFFGAAAPAGINGALSATLGSATLASAATIATAGGPVVGSLSQALGAATLASTARLDLRAQLSGTLGAATSTATGRLLVRGTLAAALGDAILASSGEVVTPPGPVVGTLSATLGDATLSAQGDTGGEPVEPPRGGYNTFGYYTPPNKRKKADDEPAIAAEIVEVATAPVFRKAAPPKPVPARMLPKAKPVDEKRVHAALEAARREWIERDEDDAIAIALILANA